MFVVSVWKLIFVWICSGFCCSHAAGSVGVEGSGQILARHTEG